MKHWMILMGTGGIAVLGGLFALFNPASAVATTATITGLALLVVGALQAYSAYRSPSLQTRAGAGVLAVLAIFMGLTLTFGPFGDGSLVRLLLGLLLLGSGAAKVWSVRHLQRDQIFLPVLIAGAVSAVLGLIILTGFPGFLANALGIVLAIELLSVGAFMISLALRRKRTEDPA